MILTPATVEELTGALTDAEGRAQKIRGVDVKAFNRIIAHTPEDMTVTVEVGITLAALQARLASQGQWLSIDPPNPQTTTISEILNANLNGPRRFGYGTIRDHLIGIKVALADGRVIKSGGNVVKNVAGYDLQKLFIGSHGSLGVIVEATFKLRPLPEAEQFVQAQCDSPKRAGELIASILESEMTPVVLDLHKLSTLNPQLSIVLGFAGTREEVDWQVAEAAKLGVTQTSNLDYETTFWQREPAPRRVSVLPSRVTETIERLEATEFVTRAGNGVIYYRGGEPPAKETLPTTLIQRIKNAYDPKNILPDLQL